MNHCGTHPIETERLLLRPFAMDDVDAMFENYAGDPRVTQYLRWKAHYNWMVTYEYLNEVVKRYSRPDFYDWAVTDKATGVLMGSISIQAAEPDYQWVGTGLDTNEVWEVGYCYGHKWWNRGYATEALRAVCEYWFDNTDATWLTGGHAMGNPVSGNVLRKAGFWFDHEAVYHDYEGNPVPCYAYFITRQDYLNPDPAAAEAYK